MGVGQTIPNHSKPIFVDLQLGPFVLMGQPSEPPWPDPRSPGPKPGSENLKKLSRCELVMTNWTNCLGLVLRTADDRYLVWIGWTQSPHKKRLLVGFNWFYISTSMSRNSQLRMAAQDASSHSDAGATNWKARPVRGGQSRTHSSKSILSSISAKYTCTKKFIGALKP